MLRRILPVLCTIVGVALTATPALANHIEKANATMTCSTYSLYTESVSLAKGTYYTVSFTIDASGSPSGFPISHSFTFKATSSTESHTFHGSFPALDGVFDFSGTASLKNDKLDKVENTIDIHFSPSSLTCGPPPPPPCTASSTNSSNFNGTPVDAGDFVWFNANFTASGIPSTGATITFTGSTITFTNKGTTYHLTVPNGKIIFSPSYLCTSTSFDTLTETWVTHAPVTGDDEIFLSGLAWQIPAGGLQGGINPVDWEGTFGTNDVPGVSIAWKWGAAAYTSFTTDYNDLGVKAGHKTACGPSNGDHAGTPEDFTSFTIGGARGGGAANATGSWSGTLSVTPVCTSSSIRTMPNLQKSPALAGLEIGPAL